MTLRTLIIIPIRLVAFGFLMVIIAPALGPKFGGFYARSMENETEYLTSDDLDGIDPNLAQNKKVNDTKNAHIPVSETEMDIARLQILLDRAGISPGSINARRSGYLSRAIRIYEEKFKRTGLGFNREKVFELLKVSGGHAFVDYEITARDTKGPFLKFLPEKIQDQGNIKTLNYLSVQEELAEKFHMDEDFLRRLNPETDFMQIGAKIKVANIGKSLNRWVGRIDANKELRQVIAYDEKGELLALYPASIGSRETPSPTGSFTVRNKAHNPYYVLSPENNFETLEGARAVKVAPGPNNPVGVAWIGLSKKTYGIHGTPFPANIGSAESHGCIRLTNWDALELARLVRKGVKVKIK